MDFRLIDKAFSLFSSDELKESQRLMHGRGREYPGFEQITMDWFAPVILLSLYKAEAGFDLHLLIDEVKTRFLSRFPTHKLQAIVLQDRSGKVSSSSLVYGELPDQVFAVEAGLRYQINLIDHQNVGFFLDAKHARARLAEIAKGKRVLNLFAYTCSFSVAALANGADSVVNLDMGRGVLERGKVNHEINQIDLRKACFLKGDIFKSWKKLHKYGRYDVIVIDPPSFQKGSFIVERDYKKIVKNLGKLLGQDAKIIACLNSPFLDIAFLQSTFLDSSLTEPPHQISDIQVLENPKAFVDASPKAGLKVVEFTYSRIE